ncbi:MAG: PepSY domain-containing protein, partial [Acidobacteriota bacterium]|nr:PepSY domain-containing protein [Acidobacteriota bacterium]
MVVGLTGSLLVFIPELRRVEVPGWTKVVPTARALPIQTSVDRLLAERPGDRLFSMSWEFKPDWALNLRTVAPNGDRIHNFVNQYDGTLLASVNYHHSKLQWFYDLHADLLTGGSGRKVNAWFAFLLATCATLGLLLWWRGIRYWKLGLEYRTQASWKRQSWDLHNLGGFIFYLPLLLLSLTGAYYAYEPEFGRVISAMTGGPSTIPPPKLQQSNDPWRPLDEIAKNALDALPGSTLSMINFPQKPGQAMSLRLKLPSDLHRIGLNWVYLDPMSGHVLRLDRFREQPLGVQLMRLMTPVHYGTIGGYATRILWIMAG